MKAEVGKYKFGRHRSLWGIWQWDSVDERWFMLRVKTCSKLY